MLRRICGVAALLTTLWAALVWLSGGIDVTVGGLHASSSDPLRPLIGAAALGLCYTACGGRAWTRHVADTMRRQVTSVRCAVLLIVVVLTLGFTYNAWTAGGSDAYSYVSQADLWLDGTLRVSVPLAARVPWPDGLATFTPFGYRPVPNDQAIAPMTGPGLPLLMAAFKLVGGHAAAFLVVPLSGALLLWVTFLLGRRLASNEVGLGAAWLVATSPTFLMMFKAQMSDVPAAAFWALATYCTFGRSVSSAVAAGTAASIATLIRPNLVPLAAVLCVWLVRFSTRRRVLSFVATAVPGSLIVALINTRLYGSPLSSGYGDLSELFSIAHVPVTLTHYGRWLVETQTPVAVAGIVMVAIAPRSLWRAPEMRPAVRALAAVALVVWTLYSIYPLFDVWWNLRFLLPSWPAMCVGVAALVMWPFSRKASWHSALRVGAIVALGVFGLVVAWQRNVFPPGEGERRYATIAELVEHHTDPDAMILASIHAGAMRYYTGRTTMRYDLLDPAWLDRAVQWLEQEGRHPYVLVEDWEMPAFRTRFSATNRLGDLRIAPLLAYQAYQIPGNVYLFDLLRPRGPTIEPLPIRTPRPLCVPPAAPARFS